MSGEKTKSRGKSKPRCMAIVICNDMIEDKRTNNKTLVGLFNIIGLSELPSAYGKFFVFLSFNGLKQKEMMKLRVKSPTDQNLEMEFEVNACPDQTVSDVVIEIHELPLFTEGVHSIDIMHGTNLLARRSFNVRLMQLVSNKEGVS